MTPEHQTQLYAAKEMRRKRLSNLSINERVEIIEKLRDMGNLLRASRPKATGIPLPDLNPKD